MRFVRRSLAVILAILFMAPAAGAQDHVISRSVLDQAIQQRVSQDQADREAILSVLQRQDVRDIAGKAGLSVDKAQTAVTMLHGKDLQLAAAEARQIQDNLAGGASTITISTTTIIIALLLIILIILIAQ